jgi:hypothetical protein
MIVGVDAAAAAAAAAADYAAVLMVKEDMPFEEFENDR